MGAARPDLLRPRRLPYPGRCVSARSAGEGLSRRTDHSAGGFAGYHVNVTDGTITFDYHGYCGRETLLAHHVAGWSRHKTGWNCGVQVMDFDLLDTAEPNRRKMLGTDQYLKDAIPRARILSTVSTMSGG